MQVKVKNLKGINKIKGLIGFNKPFCMMLKTRFGIHTFGLKFPIDILILSKENRVIKVREKLYPNKLFFWNPLYDTVLELPPGTIKNKRIKIDSQISIIIQ